MFKRLQLKLNKILLIISISGSGNCEVLVEEILDVSISGSGNVYYKGNPQINVNISGSGGLFNSN